MDPVRPLVRHVVWGAGIYLVPRLDGRLYVGDRATTLAALPAAAAAALGPQPTAQRIYLRADEGVRYGDLMGVMNRLRGEGFEKVALVAEEF